jgi:hypothetical protein
MLTNVESTQDQLKAILNQLGHEEEKTRLMLNSIPDSIAIVDPKTGSILEAFTKFCKKENTIENIYFLEFVEEYKKLDQASRNKNQKIVYGKSIPLNSSKREIFRREIKISIRYLSPSKRNCTKENLRWSWSN